MKTNPLLDSPTPDVAVERLRRGSSAHRQSVELLEGHAVNTPFRSMKLERYRLVKSEFILKQRHLPLRMANYAMYRAERGRVARVHYLPPAIGLESNATCNLRCPSCSTTQRTTRPSIRRASLDLMKAVVDESYRRCLQLSFHHQGEPLLNPDFFEASAYAVDKGLWTSIHTNLSFQIKDLGPKILDSRLCNLVISCDGATQQTYEMYRRGGSLERVIGNLQAILSERSRRKSRFPWITAKFIVFDHNWHEMPMYRALFHALGADEVLFLQGFTDGVYKTGRAASEKAFNLVDLEWSARKLPSKCEFLWGALTVDQTGNISPCCYSTDQDDFLGNRSALPSLMDAWNHDVYIQMRKHFLGEKCSRESMPVPCRTCDYTRAK